MGLAEAKEQIMFETLFEEVSKDPLWMMFGFAGQITFGGRFIIQWIASEKKKRSHVPEIFWYLSLVGSMILLIYSIHKQDIVFIAGFTLNGLIYIRNIHLIHKAKNKDIVPQ